MSSTDHGIEMLDGSPKSPDPIGPLISGDDTSRKVSFLPPSNRQMVVFQHSSSHFDALTCTLRLRTRSRMCVGH
ncbi:hypothetical protein TNIN_360141 [Trichonephila inaurata madagascariensis]|uniref:Uncharacterized protein n=1 Tax=Trichonephila inaurata madagascariensis TaxID=2747483 RepID=A0A8X6WT86_9ARAC|nr:hypothetical protein TNIN_360141 [Trichonephila inaurata madagascariensis]